MFVNSDTAFLVVSEFFLIFANVKRQFKTLEIMGKKKICEYCLYIDYDCVDEFETFEEAETAFNKAVKENPSSIIDVLSADGETSYLGYGE